MKKVKSLLLAAILSTSMSLTVFAEISVPDEVKKMDPVEAYKKGYEDGKNESNPSSNASKKNAKTVEGEIIEVSEVKEELDDSVIGKTIRTENAEITINSIKKERNDGKDIAVIEYSAKNLKDETTYASSLLYISAFQDGVEVEQAYVSIEGDNSFKKIKKDVSVDKCFIAYEIDPSVDTLQVEIGDYSNTININFNLK